MIYTFEMVKKCKRNSELETILVSLDQFDKKEIAFTYRTLIVNQNIVHIITLFTENVYIFLHFGIRYSP